jgi:hypothetical protein
MITYTRGVVIDAQGFVLAMLQWPSNQREPQLNRPKRGEVAVRPENKKTMLTEQYAIDNVHKNARWDFTPVRDPETGAVLRSGTWQSPTKKVYIVDAKTGRYHGAKKVWEDNMPILPPEIAFVNDPPPSSYTRKPLWTGAAWVYPRRVGLVDPTGVVVNVVLENPREDNANVELPEGYTRFDDDVPWPTLPDGETRVGIGYRLVDGVWQAPEAV